MEAKNSIFIGVSIDGYIADKDGGLDWLDMIPNPEGDDMGYFKFIESIDALVMGRTTFETVLGFDVDRPYKKPVFVLSTTLEEIPHSHKGKAFLVKGTLADILSHIHTSGYHRLYIDGGSTIQSFLREDLVDDMIISTIPVLLGGGSPLFGELTEHLEFELIKSTICLNQITQNHFRRKRS